MARPFLQPDANPKKAMSLFGRAFGLALDMAVGMLAFTLLGHYVDQKRGGGRGWTLTGMFVGLLYGAYEVWKVVRQIERAEAERKAGANEKGVQNASP
jgi:hypothetical protein